MGTATNRNGVIDLFKFISAIIIVLYHTGDIFTTTYSRLSGCGYIAVEFFFVVSGYLLCEKASSKYNLSSNIKSSIFSEDVEMLKRKVVHIFPYILLASITAIIFYSIRDGGFANLTHNLMYDMSDMLGLQMFGFSGFWGTGVSWYLSSLFIVSFLIYPILCRNTELFTKFIGPITALFIYGYICRKEGSINFTNQYYTYVFKGLLRGYADMSIGCIAYELKKTINTDDKMPCAVFLLCELSGYIAVIQYSLMCKYPGSADFIVLFFVFLSISVSFSEKSVLVKIFKGKVFNFLGIFSLSIYLNHFYVRKCLPVFFPTMSRHKMLALYFLLIFILATLNFTLGKIISKYINTASKVIGVCLLFAFTSTLILAGGALSKNYKLHSYFGGYGTETSPYLIDTADDLVLLGRLVNEGESFAYTVFKQTENIDLEGLDWEPIGVLGSGNYFDGLYDGDGHYIANLNVSGEHGDGKKTNGFFGALAGTVRNLGIESGTITGDCVGSIASHATGNHACIINCYNKASITGTVRAGGIADNFTGGTIINCVNLGLVNAPNSNSIVSYNASDVTSVYPDTVFPDSFDGTYTVYSIDGDSTEEILNSGIEALLEDHVIREGDTKLWE